MASCSSPSAPSKSDRQSSEALLDKLDGLLKGCTPREVENNAAVYSDYCRKGLDELTKIGAAHLRKAEQVVSDKAIQHIRSVVKVESPSDAAFTYRMLSIGCGDGSFDASIIQAIAEQFPNIKIHYIGTDIDKDICQKAEEVLKALPNVKMEIETFAFDFKDIDDFKDRIPPCDLVMASHVLYYMKDVKKALSDVQSLKKENGKAFILLTTSQSHITSLYHRFWMHDNGWPMTFPDSVVENLNNLGIHYDSQLIDGELDLTECFKDGFKGPHQRFLLDFVAHAKLQRYPEEISQVCINYLESVAVGKPEHYTIHFSAAFIVY